MGMMDHQYACDGSKVGHGGSYTGHIGPGALFTFWSLHMLTGSMRKWFHSQRQGVQYESSAYYNWPGLPDFPWESLIKLAAAITGSMIEMNWHDNGFQYLMCKPADARAGHFDGAAINNWQHFGMYWGFAASAIVDLIGWWGILPYGTEKVFLSLAFWADAVLMGLHEKDEPLDKFLHQALAASMAFSALFVALEAAHPSSYLMSCSKAGSVMLMGVILIVLGQIKYRSNHGPQWDEVQGDLAPLFYSKVLVTQSIATVVVSFAGLHMLLEGVTQGKCGTRAKHQTLDAMSSSHTLPQYNSVATIEQQA